MKILIISTLIAFTFHFCLGQNKETDSLKHELVIAKQDSNRVLILANLCYAYSNSNSDSAMLMAEKGLALAKKINFSKGEARILRNQGRLYRILGDYPKCLELLFHSVQIAKDNNYKYDEAVALNIIGSTYGFLQDYPEAINYLKKAAKILAANKGLDPNSFEYNLNLNITDSYRLFGQLDSALIYLQKAKAKIATSKRADETSRYFYSLADIQFKKGENAVAFENLRTSIGLAQKFNSHRFIATSYNLMADFFRALKQVDSSIYYAKKALSEANLINFKDSMIESSKFLAEQYEPKDIKQALYYRKVYDALNEEVYGTKKVKGLQKTLSNEQEEQRQIEAKQIAYRNQMKQYAFFVGLAVLLLIAVILYRNNRQKQKANKVLENTLSKLKSTQTQLIQSEKLASLGELTAGIAHEIQNPLNFVNNFSELSVDLADELEDEIKKPELDKDLIIDLTKDIKSNQEKINHHGKRASSIVKGMLEHSRASTGVKELTDINALADEYLRLAYHGLRAKDKDFNVTLETHFDENLPKIEVIPQDIGRVLLNLINNAFFAVSQRQNLQAEASVGLEKDLTGLNAAKVIVSTKRFDNFIEIRITDNGTGMSETTKAKIFQPFFTTKPTGQGTGLGLSLAYDIVTKGHGGTIECESIEGEGTTFIVKLPTQK